MPPFSEETVNVSGASNKSRKVSLANRVDDVVSISVKSSSYPSSDYKEEAYQLRIVWRNVFVMAYLHLAGLYGLYLSFTSAQFKTIVAGEAGRLESNSMQSF